MNDKEIIEGLEEALKVIASVKQFAQAVGEKYSQDYCDRQAERVKAEPMPR